MDDQERSPDQVCATCKHWLETPKDWPNRRRGGVCALTQVLQREEPYPASKAVAYGNLFIDRHEMVNLWLSTAPDFGCNQWEPKS